MSPTVLDLPLTAWELVVLRLQPMDRLRLAAVNQWCRSLLVGKSFVTASVEDFHLAPAPLSRTRLYETTMVSSEQLPHGLCLEVGCDWGDELAGRAMLEDVAKFVRDRVHTFRSIRFSPVHLREHAVHCKATKYWESGVSGTEPDDCSTTCTRRATFASKLLNTVLGVLRAEQYAGAVYLQMDDTLPAMPPLVSACIRELAGKPQPFTLHLVGTEFFLGEETLKAWKSKGKKGVLPKISSMFLEAESHDAAAIKTVTQLGTSLQALSLAKTSWFGGAEAVPVEAIMPLTQLTSLRFDGFTTFTPQIADNFKRLVELDLVGFEKISELTALSQLSELRRLALDTVYTSEIPPGGNTYELYNNKDPLAFEPSLRITPPKLDSLQLWVQADGSIRTYTVMHLPPVYAFADCKTLQHVTLVIADYSLDIKDVPRCTGDLLWVSVEHTFAPLADLPDLHSILIRGRGPDSSPHGLWSGATNPGDTAEGPARAQIDLGSAFASRPFASARKVQVDGFRLIQCADLPRGASLQSTNDMGMRLRKGPDSVLGYEVFVHPMDRVARVGFEAWPIPPENDWDALAEEAGFTVEGDEGLLYLDGAFSSGDEGDSGDLDLSFDGIDGDEFDQSEEDPE